MASEKLIKGQKKFNKKYHNKLIERIINKFNKKNNIFPFNYHNS